MQFAKYFRAEHFDIYNKIDWEDKYKNAEINITATTTIVNQGLLDVVKQVERIENN